MTQRRGKDEEEARVTGGGLLDLRKITLGHRLSLTVMLPGDTLSKGRKEENTERNVGPRVHLLNAPRLYPGQITRGSGEIKSGIFTGSSTRDYSGVRNTFFRAIEVPSGEGLVPFEIAGGEGCRYWSQEVLHDPCYSLVIRSTPDSIIQPVDAVEKVSSLPPWCCCNVCARQASSVIKFRYLFSYF